MNDYDWMEKAACRGCDPNLFFPQKGQHDLIREGRKICEHCVVRVECETYAVDHYIILGTWGGLSPKQRRRQRNDKPDQRNHNTTRPLVRLATNGRDFHERDHNPERAGEATRAVG